MSDAFQVAPVEAKPGFKRLWLWVVMGLLILGGGFWWAFLRPSDDNQASAPPSKRVVYFSPSVFGIANLYITDIYTGDTLPLTKSLFGVDYESGFSLSPDGQSIAFAMFTDENQEQLEVWLVNINTGELTQLTNCAEANASCFSPTWHPSGDFVGFTRRELAPDLDNINRNRAWLVDVETGAASLLFDDEQIIGHTPLWSSTGERVALVSTNPPGVLIYSYADRDTTLIPTQQNLNGVFSPDGQVFIYPQIQTGANAAMTYNQLYLLNFENALEIPVSGGRQNPVEDIRGAFHPQGTKLAVARRFLDNRYTQGTQIHLIDLETGDSQPLLVDANYSYSSPDWDSSGKMLVVQRFDYLTTQVDIGVLNLADGTFSIVATNGLLPQFID
jgi:Tol biopolymer transport system component